MSNKALPQTKPESSNDPRNPDYVVRARTGPARKDWSTVGVAWNSNNGEGISVKLNSIPIGGSWDGILKALPALASDEDDSQGDALEETH